MLCVWCCVASLSWLCVFASFAAVDARKPRADGSSSDIGLLNLPLERLGLLPALGAFDSRLKILNLGRLSGLLESTLVVRLLTLREI